MSNFNVGDKVTDNGGYPRCNAGKVGTVIRFWDDKTPQDSPVVEVDGEEWYYIDSELELVEEPTMKIKSQSDDAQLRLEAEKRGYKKVVITEDVCGWPVGTIAWMDPNNCTHSNAYNDDCSKSWTHTVGDNCKWLEEEAEEMTPETQSVEQEGNYKTWGEMTPEEKGALLLAHHEGKVIEVWYPFAEVWVPKDCSFLDSDKYRVKPEEPKVEEKVFNEAYFESSYDGFPIVLRGTYGDTTKGKATVTYTDGKPTKMVWEADI